MQLGVLEVCLENIFNTHIYSGGIEVFQKYMFISQKKKTEGRILSTRSSVLVNARCT